MKLTHSQISEILSNYTSSSEGFVTLQSLIMNSLMFHEREVFVSANGNEQYNGFRSDVGTVTALSFPCVSLAAAAATSIPFSWA